MLSKAKYVFQPDFLGIVMTCSDNSLYRVSYKGIEWLIRHYRKSLLRDCMPCHLTPKRRQRQNGLCNNCHAWLLNRKNWCRFVLLPKTLPHWSSPQYQAPTLWRMCTKWLFVNSKNFNVVFECSLGIEVDLCVWIQSLVSKASRTYIYWSRLRMFLSYSPARWPLNTIIFEVMGFCLEHYNRTQRPCHKLHLVISLSILWWFNNGQDIRQINR